MRLDDRRDNADAARRTAIALRPPRDAVRHHHRFAAGGRAVVHRGIGDIHAGQHARPGSGIRTASAACPARFPAGRACRRSGTRRAGSGDRRSPAHDGDRRRRRGRTARRRRRCSSPPARQMPLDLQLARHGAADRPGPFSRAACGTSANRSSIDCGADRRQHRGAVGIGQRQIAHQARALRRMSCIGGLVHQPVELGLVGELQLEEPAVALRHRR